LAFKSHLFNLYKVKMRNRISSTSEESNYLPFTVFEKKEYDIILTNGQHLPNCYPNVDEFIQLVTPEWIVRVDRVAYIRLAAHPVTSVNSLHFACV